MSYVLSDFFINPDQPRTGNDEGKLSVDAAVWTPCLAPLKSHGNKYLKLATFI